MLEIDKHIPSENWYVGLIFEEGYWFIQLKRKQRRTKYAPFWFNSGTAIAVDSTSDFETPTDSEGRYYFEPQEKDIIYQCFVGITPTSGKLYLSYPKRVDRMSLISVRDIPGDEGYWDGEDTPYRDPSPETELWTLEDIVPYFNAENNGVTGESTKIGMSFYITPYSYKVVQNREKIQRFIDGKDRSTIRTMGDPDQPISAPAWLLRDFGDYMIDVEEE